MALSDKQLGRLMEFVASVTPDSMSCDGCFKLVPELAESQLGNIPLSAVLEKVQSHLDNCPCCADEYAAFLEALEHASASGSDG